MCNLTSKHSIGANCTESNEEDTFALSQLMDHTKIKDKHSKDINKIECMEATQPTVTETEIVLDAENIFNYVRHYKTIKQCEECVRHLQHANITQFVQETTNILERTFMNICYEPKLSEKLTHILEEKYLMSFPIYCTHFKTVLLNSIVTQFIKISCTFINNILCRKTDIHSNNYLYNTAKRLSTKYIKKCSETKPKKRQ